MFAFVNVTLLLSGVLSDSAATNIVWLLLRANMCRSWVMSIAGSATAPRLVMRWWFRPSPHSRLRRQYGVIEAVTAHAVNIDGTELVVIALYEEHPLANGAEES